MPFFMQTSNVQQSIKDTRNIIGTSVSLSQEREMTRYIAAALVVTLLCSVGGDTCLSSQPQDLQ